jgi:hypothetical protein
MHIELELTSITYVGLDSSILQWICNRDVKAYSPTLLLRRIVDLSPGDQSSLLPLLPKSIGKKSISELL